MRGFTPVDVPARPSVAGMLPGRGRYGRCERGGELQRVQHGALLPLPRHLRAGHGRRWVGRDDTVDDRVLVERGHRAEPPSHRRGRIAPTLQVPHIQLEFAAADPQRLPVIGLAPAKERLEVLGVGGQGRFPVAGQERHHRQPGHIQVARHQLLVVVVIAAPPGTAGSRSPGTPQIIYEVPIVHRDRAGTTARSRIAAGGGGGNGTCLLATRASGSLGPWPRNGGATSDRAAVGSS